MNISEINPGHSVSSAHNLSSVVVHLLKGVLYQDDNPLLWRSLLNLQASVRDYVAVLGVDLIFDEAEGYAFLRSRQHDDEDGCEAMPRLIARRQLSFPVSLLLALLRKKLVEFDAGGSSERLVLSRDKVVELVRIFLPAGSNEAKLIDQIETALNKIAEMGFVRRLRGQGQLFEVRRIIKAFVDAQWGTALNERLAEYQQQLTQQLGGSNVSEP